MFKDLETLDGYIDTNNLDKLCLKCHQIKSITNFTKNKHKKDGVTIYCKLCFKAYYDHKKITQRDKIREQGKLAARKYRKTGKWQNNTLKYRYKITIDDKNKVEKLQNGKCAICKCVSKLHVDHCHNSNLFRGLLCRNCNLALGLFKHKIDSLLSAAKYLQKNA